MRFIIIGLLFITTLSYTEALIINEIMSNPIGEDSGREWVEVYNDTDNDVDLSSLSVSIKGGSFVPVTLISGGGSVAPHGYAIIGSVVSGVTRFLQDYGTYTGSLFKSSISLVNTGNTSIDIKLQGTIVDSVTSYTAVKEGSTYSKINGSFVTALPTPGEENRNNPVSPPDDATTTPSSASQTTIPRSSPSADIVLYLPLEKVVVAGAPSLFTVSAATHAGKAIDSVGYTWSFGDGGERTGSTTLYRYFYPGRYVAQVEGSNGLISGVGRMIVKVVSPELSIASVAEGKYGKYIEITNQNTYDIDISDWKIAIDGTIFPFPKNTLLLPGVTRYSGIAMGFASTTLSSSTLIKLLFPNMEELLRIYQGKDDGGLDARFIEKTLLLATTSLPKVVVSPEKMIRQKPASFQQKVIAPRTQYVSSTTVRVSSSSTKKDTRVASFLKSMFSK